MASEAIHLAQSKDPVLLNPVTSASGSFRGALDSIARTPFQAAVTAFW